jgi:hypothetical protein
MTSSPEKRLKNFGTSVARSLITPIHNRVSSPSPCTPDVHDPPGAGVSRETTQLRITRNATTISVMKRALPLFLLALTAVAQSGKQPLTNADVIEMSRVGVPESTIILAIRNTPVKFDVSAEGILALHSAGVKEQVLNQMLRAAAPQKQGGASFGVATGSFPVSDAAGKTVHFSAWIRTENVVNGYAGLWWRVDGPGEGSSRPQLAFDNSMVRFINGKPDTGNGTIRGATGTTPWTLYEFELPVGKTASNINFGVLFTGTGTAWVDSMKVELDGQPYSNPQFDFDFESPMAKGFYTGSGGSGDAVYKVGIDDTTSFSGHQSLKMQSVGEVAAQK